MKSLRIYTNTYIPELTSWSRQAKDIIKDGHIQSTYFVDIKVNEQSKLCLADMLEDILLYKNPITKAYKVLYEHIKDTVFLEFRNNILDDLTEFIENNNELNLEGYTTFKMDRYNHIINMTLYAIVKRSFYQ